MHLMRFQSAPDQLIGRYAELERNKLDCEAFQSAPDYLIGRYVAATVNTGSGFQFQSAPDQLIGRYAARGPVCPGPACFNPRPTN